MQNWLTSMILTQLQLLTTTQFIGWIVCASLAVRWIFFGDCIQIDSIQKGWIVEFLKVSHSNALRWQYD